MERQGYVRAIQGGGTGSGFKEPRQISDYEHRLFSRLKMQFMASFEVGNKNESDDHENNKRLVWKREAEDRFRTLYKRKKIAPSQKSLTGNTIVHESSQVFQDSMVSFNERSPVQNCDAVVVQCGKGCSQITAAQLSDDAQRVVARPPSHKYVPDLPRKIEDLVKLWRFGCKHTGFKPVRIFLKASSRRTIIKSYSDKFWNQSGQKSAFYRFKDIAEFVLEHGPVTLAFDKEGKDEAWEFRIANLKKLELFEKESVSLSAVLRYIRDERRRL